jgi:hypothetical protein
VRTGPSDADKTLTDEVRDLGASWVKSSQVQGWHEYGVISADRRWLGRARGSESSYPPQTAALVARFAHLVRLLRSIDAATIWMFLEDSTLGEQIGERGLKRALRWAVAGLPDSGDDAPATHAREVAEKLARDRSASGWALRGFLGVRGPELKNVLRDFAASALGQPAPIDPSRRSTPLLVRALHLEERYADDPQAVARVLNSRMSTVTRGSLDSLIDSATPDDLKRARVVSGSIPTDAIEQVKPGLRKSLAAMFASLLLSHLRDQVFEREATRTSMT